MVRPSLSIVSLQPVMAALVSLGLVNTCTYVYLYIYISQDLKTFLGWHAELKSSPAHTIPTRVMINNRHHQSVSLMKPEVYKMETLNLTSESLPVRHVRGRLDVWPLQLSHYQQKVPRLCIWRGHSFG